MTQKNNGNGFMLSDARVKELEDQGLIGVRQDRDFCYACGEGPETCRRCSGALFIKKSI